MRGDVLLKPEPLKRAKARRKRQEAKVVKSVRAQVEARDGLCRLYRDAYLQRRFLAAGMCEGASEWAHLGDMRRFKTRGKAPELRHTTAGSLMLCTKHHQDYDQGRMVIEGHDANGVLRFEVI